MKNILDDIKKDLIDYGRNIAKYSAIQVRDELAKTTYNAIDLFYKDYEPVYYKRHYYNFYEKSFYKYYKNNHGTVFSGGVVISDENMDDIYRADTDWVFGLVYMGIHGDPTDKKTHRMKIPPYEMVYLKQQELLKNSDSIINNSIDLAKKEEYKYIFK